MPINSLDNIYQAKELDIDKNKNNYIKQITMKIDSFTSTKFIQVEYFKGCLKQFNRKYRIYFKL
jgi:hypothetical protein